MILITWPFMVWCHDMVEEFKKMIEGFNHLLVDIDKFTKWVEVRPIVNLKSERATEFI